MDELEFEVVVIGGGVSGVCAAIASARAGMKTVLIQNRPVLGGNSSSEIRVWTRGAIGGGNIYAEEMGILGEIKLHNLLINPNSNPVLWDEVLLDMVYQEKNIILLLNTHIISVLKNDENKIYSIRAVQLGSEKEYEILGQEFIDATGDGTIAYLSGVPYRFGREDKAEFNESLALDNKDNYVLGSSIMFQSKDEGKTVPFVKPTYAYDLDYIKKLLDKGGRIVNEKMNGCDYWWVEFGGALNTIEDNLKITFELKKLVMGIWNYIKNSGEFKADTLTLEWIGNIPGKRESRRFIGEYMLNENDVKEGGIFKDAVCYGGWWMDFHPSEGIYSEEDFCNQLPVHSYNIPLRCLYNKDFENIIFAGRIISVTHAAFSSIRIMNTCGMIGQVAGELAAFCIKNKCAPDEVNAKYISKLQQLLIKNDMTILGFENEDAEDKAKLSKVSCSEMRKVHNPLVEKYIGISEGTFFICPKVVNDAEKGNNKIDVYIKAEKDSNLEAILYEAKLPSRIVNGDIIDRQKISVVKGQEKIEIDLSKISNGFYCKIIFEKNNDVSLGTTSKSLTGYLAGNEKSAFYDTPCINYEENVYKCTNVINGQNRIYGNPNLWISEDMSKEQWLNFKWDEEINVNELRLTFNPDISKEIPSSISKVANPHHGFVKRSGMAPEMIKDFDIYGKQDDNWILIKQVENNYQRLCVVDIDQIVTDEIKIVFKNTYGSNYAEVFEVRIY